MSRHTNVRSQPHNDDAERAMLGAVFVDGNALADVRAIVAAEDIYREPHRHIFRAMCALADEGVEVDAITVGDKLHALGLLDAVGGMGFVMKLAHETASAANVEHYATITKRTDTLRRLIATTADINDLAYSNPSDFVGFLASAEEELLGIIRDSVGASFRHIREAAKDAVEKISLRQNGEQTGMPIPWPELEEQLGSIEPGDLTVVAVSYTHLTLPTIYSV